jgi:hypothetical protein
MAVSIIGCLRMQYKPASDADERSRQQRHPPDSTQVAERDFSWTDATSVGQVEVDGDDDFGLRRLAIDGSGRVAPEGDGIHSDLREQRIAAHTSQATRHTVFSDHRTDTHRSL